MSEINIVNEKVNALEKRVNNLEQDRSELSKLGAIMKMQVDAGKEHDKFLREQSNLLIKMGENLTSLNDVTNKLDDRIGNLEDEVVQNKLNNLQESLNVEKSNSIHIPQLVKNIVATVATSVIVGILMYAISNNLFQ